MRRARCVSGAWPSRWVRTSTRRSPRRRRTEAYQAIEEAKKLGGAATERERAYIDALAKRYVADPRAARGPLDAAYAAAMRELARSFPDDLDASTLFAQSLMDTSPWNYWGLDGTPREFTRKCSTRSSRS